MGSEEVGKSKYLIECLHALGFSSSYREVLMFERNAAMVCGAELEGYLDKNSSVKFSADNVDHNTCTLNGQNTFHGMGMIASISKGKFRSKQIPRKKGSDKELLKVSHVEIIQYQKRKHLLKGIKFKPLQKQNPTSSFIDLLWKVSWHFKTPTPIWSGTMQLIHENQNKENYEKDSITFLPIIDLDPANMSCILSTLSFLSNLAHQNNMPTVVAFDQPLYWKGSRIILESTDELIKQIVLVLGNFRTIFNLLGCIGFLMADTGLNNILHEI